MFLNECLLVDMATSEEVKDVNIDSITIKLTPPIVTVNFTKTVDDFPYSARIENIKTNNKSGVLTLYLTSIQKELS